MVKIRLKRMGTTKRPVYRLVVADSRSPRDGRFIEAIGFYDPLPNPAVVRVDADKVRDWMRKGARPSDSARFLLVQQGILAPLPRRERPQPTTDAGGDAGSSETKSDAAGPAASGYPPAGGTESAGKDSSPPASPTASDQETESPSERAENAGEASQQEAAEPAPETAAPADAQVDEPTDDEVQQ